MNRLPAARKRKYTILLGDHEVGANKAILSCFAHVSKRGDEMGIPQLVYWCMLSLR
jgi:hypothetical protein